MSKNRDFRARLDEYDRTHPQQAWMPSPRSEEFNAGVSTPRPDADRNWMHARAFGTNPMQQQGAFQEAKVPNEEEQHRYLSEEAASLPKKPSYDRGF